MHLYSRNIKRTASKGTASLSSLRYLVRYSVAYKVIFKAVDNLKDGFLYEQTTKHEVVYDIDTRLVLLGVIGTQ